MKRMFLLILCEFALRNKAEYSDECSYLPLVASSGSVDTCCFYAGRNRLFGDSTWINPRFHSNQRLHQEQLPPMPRRGSMCHLHPIIVRGRKVGVCCLFMDKYFERPGSNIQRDRKVSFFSFIDGSCSAGYVLDSNNNCVKDETMDIGEADT